MKEFYEVNKDRWYWEDDKGKKHKNPHWKEYWCNIHKDKHAKEIGA